ncbi:hypothetical protein ABMA28_003979 [Loxostege sticticalis]|uniref:C-type lectin domain-containing protein n=1 Tax=Loxostege sticticalis TaxID=481309 RepID=A0ABD0SU82_LOXSC
MRTFIGVFMVTTYIATTFCDVPEGYTVNPTDNYGYKVMYQSQNWTVARDTCASMGAKLAVPKSREQFNFIQRLVATMHYPSIVGTKFKLLVWLGISNLDNYQTWKNIDGENINDTGFHTWSGHNGNISENPAEPHCVGMDAANPGLRDWWCHKRQPYICEIQTQ